MGPAMQEAIPRLALGKNVRSYLKNNYQKRNEDMAQVIEHLPSARPYVQTTILPKFYILVFLTK
jgi:hypothetical protein